jgi:hypothetical protein
MRAPLETHGNESIALRVDLKRKDPVGVLTIGEVVGAQELVELLAVR